jgi:CcmD family protein
MRSARTHGTWARLGAALLLAGAVGFLPIPAGTPILLGATQPPAGQEEFVPIDQLPPDEELPAAPLVIGAYAIAWLAVFGYLWSIWQRTTRVERDLAELTRRVHARGDRR